MMRAVLLALVATLAACSAAPPPKAVDLSSTVQAQPARPSMQIVGTLSTNDCEAIVAPYYTQAIVAVHQATSRVRAGTLTPDEGVRILNLGKIARHAFDISCPNGVLNLPAIQEGQSAVNTMHDLLETTP